MRIITRRKNKNEIENVSLKHGLKIILIVLMSKSELEIGSSASRKTKLDIHVYSKAAKLETNLLKL